MVIILGEQAHTFGDLGSTVKKLRKTIGSEGLREIRELFLGIKGAMIPIWLASESKVHESLKLKEKPSFKTLSELSGLFSHVMQTDLLSQKNMEILFVCVIYCLLLTMTTLSSCYMKLQK